MSLWYLFDQKINESSFYRKHIKVFIGSILKKFFVSVKPPQIGSTVSFTVFFSFENMKPRLCIDLSFGKFLGLENQFVHRHRQFYFYTYLVYKYKNFNLDPPFFLDG